MKSTLICLTFCLTVSSLIGCGESTEAPADAVVETAPVNTDEMKQALQEVASSGTVTSALAGIEETINQMSDAAKKENLSKKYTELMAASKPADVKRLANEMLKEL